MSSNTTTRKLNTLIGLGMVAFVLANIVAYVLRRKAGLPDSVADPVSGFFYGVAIAMMLLGIVLRARRSRGDTDRSLRS